MDDYEPIVEEDLSTLYPSGADVYLENIKYIVLGNGQATSASKILSLCLAIRLQDRQLDQDKKVFVDMYETSRD